MRQQGQHDGSAWATHEREVVPVFEEPVVIKRWTGKTGGNGADGVAATDTFTLIKTTANISDLAATDIATAGGLYILGDLQAEFRIPVYGGEAATGDALAAGHRPDRATYRGRDYYFVGHVHRLNENGRVYWQGILRQTGS